MTLKKLFPAAVILLLTFFMFASLPICASMHDEAAQISVNQAVSDNLPTPETVKYYMFELPSPGKVYLSFNHTNLGHTNILWKLTVFDSDENEMLYFQSSGKDSAGKSMNAYLDKGTYYIRVASGGSSFLHSNTEYKLTVNYAENNGEFEIEHNNEFETATLISELNNPITGNIRTYNDIDFYRITLQSPGKVYLNFKHSNLENGNILWKITLFDSDENEMLYYQSSGRDTNGKSINAYLDKGTYYIRVISGGNSYFHSDIDYKLTVNYAENNGEYEVEHNDSIEQASNIYEINSPIIGNIRTYSDIDYYKFTMPASGRISLSFKHSNLEHGNIYWKIVLFDSSGKDLIRLDSEANDTEVKSGEIKVDKGTYFIRVVSPGYYFHSDIDYTLKVISPDIKPAVKVLLNGKRILFDQPPIIQNGRTLVPLRAIFEAMGATVEWDQKTQTVTASNGEITVVMKVGDNTMLKNGTKITLDVPPQIVNNRTLVPARAVAESFEADVQWDGSTQTVIINH